MIKQSADYIKSVTDLKPEIGIIAGSGLGGIAEKIENAVFIDYKDIPHFAVSTAPNHIGRFVIGKYCGKTVICMQGRLHYYEGHSMKDVVYPVRVMNRLGVKTLIVTNAAGGINTEFSVGDIMLIQDHINMMGTNPFIGKNDDEEGLRFFDMTNAYSPGLCEIAVQAAAESGIALRRGVYVATTGPSFETPAEVRAFRTLGGDAVGMSTVPEVIAAAHCSMETLAFSLITNAATGVTDTLLSGDDVIEIGRKKAGELSKLVEAVLYKL